MSSTRAHNGVPAFGVALLATVPSAAVLIGLGYAIGRRDRSLGEARKAVGQAYWRGYEEGGMQVVVARGNVVPMPRRRP